MVQQAAPRRAGAAGGATSRADPAGSRPRRLQRQPALDGIRGLAIVLVVCKHIGVLRGGYVGVDLFFVLSGFLITTLLLQERERCGRVRLGAFYARRARRLLPALALTLPLGWLTRSVYPHGLARLPYWAAVLGALTYVNNWVQVADHHNLRVLAHTWSLAVEEQFYLLWPVTLLRLVRRGRHRETTVLVAVGGVVAVSLSYMAVTSRLDAGANLYVSTISRAGELLLGAGLSVLWRHRRMPTALTSSVALAAALATLLWLARSTGLHTGWLYEWGGLYLGAAAAIVLIATALERPRSWTSRVLGSAPVRYTGRISYGMYLYNYPLSFALSAEVTGLSTWLSRLAVVSATWALGAASFHLVEQPILHGRGVRRGTGQK